ncbi:MAG: HIT family protein [Pseudomonadota bacterium]
MERCIFCDIVRGNAAAERIYEDQDILAFLDINPVNPGHALVIPRDHHETYLDLPDALLAPLGMALRRVAAAVLRTTGAGGLNLVMNNYRAAGQLVPHVHWHVVPRHPDDGLRHWPGRPAGATELSDMAKRIRETL